MSKEHARIVWITPDHAKKLLAGTPQEERHRELQLDSVLKYTEEMRQGKWRFVGKSVVVDSDGKLRNGQHRLSACVLANRAFRTVLVTGVNPSEFKDWNEHDA